MSPLQDYFLDKARINCIFAKKIPTMDHSSLADLIRTGIEEAAQSKINRKEIVNQEVQAGRHQFLFFIKPEITLKEEGKRMEQILQMIFEKINSFGLSLSKAVILAAPYLEQFNIIARHYGVINAIARDAKSGLTDRAKASFNDHFGIDFNDCEVYGGIELLAAFPDLSAVSLDYLWQNAPVVKLGGGAYAQSLKLDGKQIYLVNGFHPRQLEHYTASGRSIVAFTLSGDLGWSAARNKFIGKTNPVDAEAGSIRRTLLDNKEKFGLRNVNSSWNGVHLSAGPVESLVELIRYNSDYLGKRELSISDFTFGKMLEEKFTPENVQKILGNQSVLWKDKRESVFDLTEEKDAVDAIEILSKAFAANK
jgi:hypothetical protein